MAVVTDFDVAGAVRNALQGCGTTEEDVAELVTLVNAEAERLRAEGTTEKRGIIIFELPDIVEQMSQCLRAKDMRAWSKLMFVLGIRARDPGVIQELAAELLDEMNDDVRDWWLHELCPCGFLGPHQHN